MRVVVRMLSESCVPMPAARLNLASDVIVPQAKNGPLVPL